MPETWINYRYLGKDGKLVKTEKLPERDTLFVYETAVFRNGVGPS
jgi:hypothetical protein